MAKAEFQIGSFDNVSSETMFIKTPENTEWNVRGNVVINGNIYDAKELIKILETVIELTEI